MDSPFSTMSVFQTFYCLSYYQPATPSPRPMLKAHITVISKEGKGPTQVSNYRPITLINVDIKLHAKILANRMLPFIPNLISLDQVVFIPGRDNTIHTLNLCHWLRAFSSPLMQRRHSVQQGGLGLHARGLRAIGPKLCMFALMIAL